MDKHGVDYAIKASQRIQELEARVTELRQAGKTALRQWRMYAGLEEDCNLPNGTSAEAKLYRAVCATLEESV